MTTEIVIIHDTSGVDPHPGLCRCRHYCAWCSKQILSPVKPMEVLAVVCSLRCKVEYGNYLESLESRGMHAAAQDAVIYGQGFARVSAENVEHIAATEVLAQPSKEGKVLVPVKLIEFIEAKEHHLPIEDRHALSVMLNASKGE